MGAGAGLMSGVNGRLTAYSKGKQHERGHAMTMIQMERVSTDSLQQERTALLAAAGLPLAELRRRAETYDLSIRQRDILEQIEDLDFLLAED